MAYCNPCGHELPHGARFCASYGTAVGVAAPTAPLPEAIPPAQGHFDNGESAVPPAGQTSKETRNMAVLCHLASFAGIIGVPFGNILGPSSSGSSNAKSRSL